MLDLVSVGFFPFQGKVYWCQVESGLRLIVSTISGSSSAKSARIYFQMGLVVLKKWKVVQMFGESGSKK